MAGFQKILRHRHSHIAESEEADSRHFVSRLSG